MFRLICLCIGYCIGCIETAYVVGRIWQVDLLVEKRFLM